MQSSAPAGVELAGWLVALLSLAVPALAAEADGAPSTPVGEDPFTETPAPSAPHVTNWAPPPPELTSRQLRGYQHWLGGAYIGRGLRFNNPYRLRTELGNSAQSLSLTATYLDLQAVRLFSDPGGFEHGVSLDLSIATDGIRQEVLTPGYVLLHRFGPRFLGYGRAGFPIVLEPDAAVGLEAGLGGAYFFTANLGLGAQLVESVFYGASTVEKGVTVYPITSLQLGAIFDWEKLP
jgi:hypothetical protein